MLAFGWMVGLTVVGASAATAALLLWIVSRMAPEPERPQLREAKEGAERCVMLFDGPNLFDATPPARALLDAIEGGGPPRARLVRHLEARFGSLGGALEDLEALGRVEFRAGGDRLTARWSDGLIRIELIEARARDAAGEGAQAHLDAVEEELRTLRAAVEACPWPIWSTGPDGGVVWANPAYVERAAPAGSTGPPGWPPAALLEGQGTEVGVAGAIDALTVGAPRRDGPPRRLRAAPGTRAAGTGDDSDAWYDCVARPGPAPGRALRYAAPAAEAVRAERSLEQFVQTLSKTFAHLPVGLAVFDARRGLSLFNPALTELTTLPIEFLATRPTLHGFIDRLREARRMPEPRDYRGWRERITALEAASAEGTYLETWNLAGGQTWRVSGRPHPDGAIALMFEDITSEIALTRRFRSELEIGQAVVDAMHEAIAVFAPDGVLTLANEAYARLWESDPRTSLGDLGVADASRGWMERCEPAPLWGELRDFVGQIGERAPWTSEARLRDGRRLRCRAVPLSAGATLIGFAAEPAEAAPDAARDEAPGDAMREDAPPAGFTPRLIRA